MTLNTNNRHKAAILRKFGYRINWSTRTPTTIAELDLLLDEMVNHSWQDDLPEQHAMDGLSGFARLLPHCRSIGWDVCRTPEGPVIIEANQNWGLEFFQRPLGGQAAGIRALLREGKEAGAHG